MPNILNIKSGVKALSSNTNTKRIGDMLKLGSIGVGALGALGVAYNISRPAFRPDTYKTHLTNNVMAGKIKMQELNQGDFDVVKKSPLFKKLRFQDEQAAG